MSLKKATTWKVLNHWLSKPIIQLSLIVMLAFGLRLMGINNPLLDWHAFRQVDTAAITRYYVQQQINLKEPHYHDLSNIQSGKDNLAGYRMVEFPWVNGLIAVVIKLLPSLDLVVASRLMSIIFSLCSLVFCYSLIELIKPNSKISLLTTLGLAILPYSVFYSRAVLPEPALLATSLGSLYFLTRYLKKGHQFSHWLLATILLALAFLLKPVVAFNLPVYLVLLWQNDRQFYKKIEYYLLAISAVLPFLAWRWWIKQFPSGIPAADWLLNGDGIRWRPAWWRWLGYERLTKLITGGLNLWFWPWLAINLKKVITDQLFQITLSWGIGLLAYLSVIATGNVRHDYYQVFMLPFICLSLAQGTELASNWLNTFLRQRFPTLTKLALGRITKSELLTIGVMSFIWLTGIGLSWQQVKGYYQINHWEYVKAGQAADQLLPADAKVIAPAMGDTMFLFQTNRWGWPIGFEIDQKIKLGATHYVTTSYDDEARNLETKYATIKKTTDYLILDLTHAK